MPRLTQSLYRDLCVLAGDDLDHPEARVQKIGSVVGWPVGVYLLGHRDPVRNSFMVDYVGSTARTRSDIAARMQEHLRDEGKRARFTCQVVLPLKKDTDLAVVRRLEGAAARALGVPRWCKRVPGGRG
ncbi:hypothetical protein [Modestobacter sp. SYSU DS0290]